MLGQNNTGSGEYVLQIIGVGVCLLSMLGSLAIIVTYALLKEIRSKAREILVHISLMDVTYTVANFFGLTAQYWNHQYKHDDKLCKAQAFAAVYGTVSSVLWTLALAVYLYYKIVSRDDKVTKRLVGILYVVCYALPLYVSLWLLLDDHLGYSNTALSGAGWCSLNRPPAIVGLMTYDIWIWLGIIILLPLYLVIHTDIRDQASTSTVCHDAVSCVSYAWKTYAGEMFCK